MERQQLWTGFRQRRASRRRALGGAVAVGGAAGLMSACGRGKQPAPGKATGAGQAAQPRSGGQLNLLATSDPVLIDPAVRHTTAMTYLVMTCSSLLHFKTGAGVSYSDIVVQPHLAERWESPDPLTYTFHLHPDVKFQNLAPVNGRPCTAADVKWTFEYLSRTGDLAKLRPAATAAMFTGLDRITTPDASTVVVHFKQPSAPFLHQMASAFTSVLPHEIYDQDGDFSKRMVGTGPWQWDTGASQAGAHWVFQRNPNYFEKGLPYIDQIRQLVVADDVTQDAAFKAKQADVLDYSGLTLETVQQVQKSTPGVMLAAPLGFPEIHFYINVTKPPFNDERIRKALALALDRDEFVKALTNGKGEWALASGVPGLFTQDEMKRILKHDPAEARRLIDAAGYSNGAAIEADKDGFGQAFGSMLELLQAQVKKVGFNMTLKDVDGATDAKARRSGAFQLNLTPFSGPGVPGDLDDPLYSTYYPGSGDNYGHIDDPKLTAMLDAERRELDAAKRRELIRAAVQYINEAAWGLALYHAPLYNLWQPYLKNYDGPHMPVYGEGYLAECWLEK